MYQCPLVSRVGMEGMIIFPRNLEKASYRLVVEWFRPALAGLGNVGNQGAGAFCTVHTLLKLYSDL